jgi:hypothetical protein
MKLLFTKQGKMMHAPDGDSTGRTRSERKDSSMQLAN